MKQKHRLILTLCCYLASLIFVQITYGRCLLSDEIYGIIGFLLGGKLWLLGHILAFLLLCAHILLELASEITAYY